MHVGRKGTAPQSSVIKMTATLHAGTCSKVRTYKLDASRWIHGANQVEESVEYHSDHRDGYTQCRHIHKR